MWRTFVPLLILALGCSDTGPASPVARGEQVYRANCIVCHHPDPRQDGSVGPAIAGAPRELLEARVLRAEYPPGYTPKKDSRLMPPLPHLAGDIDALAAYLGSLGPDAARDGAAWGAGFR
jgi:mono/diheme cytochrome c family protein